MSEHYELYWQDGVCGLAVSHSWFVCPMKQAKQAEADAALGAAVRKAVKKNKDNDAIADVIFAAMDAEQKEEKHDADRTD